MKLYDKVTLTKNIDNYEICSLGIIIELYDGHAYLEMFDYEYLISLSLLRNIKW